MSRRGAARTSVGTLAWAAALLTACGASAPPPEDPSRPAPGDESVVFVPAGTLLMGSDEELYSAPRWYMPAHEVEVAAFSIDLYEVTLGQFERFVSETDYEPEAEWKKFWDEGHDDRPVVQASYRDAEAYCAWAGKRLPTEAEWERAARGPKNLSFPWGDGWRPGWSNTQEREQGAPDAVGTNPGDMSGFGVYDMAGNVAEWTAQNLYPYPGSPADDPDFPTDFRAFRGGNFNLRGEVMPLWLRMGAREGAQVWTGFRCARSEGRPDGSARTGQAPAAADSDSGADRP